MLGARALCRLFALSRFVSRPVFPSRRIIDDRDRRDAISSCQFPARVLCSIAPIEKKKKEERMLSLHARSYDFASMRISPTCTPRGRAWISRNYVVRRNVVSACVSTAIVFPLFSSLSARNRASPDVLFSTRLLLLLLLLARAKREREREHYYHTLTIALFTLIISSASLSLATTQNSSHVWKCGV